MVTMVILDAAVQSTKFDEFNEAGNEVNSDFLRIMKIVKESGFKGYVGIEYEGTQL